MKKLNIEITKAQLTGFNVQLDPEDQQVKVSATIALMTEGGKGITDYTICTHCWNDKDKFTLPIACIKPITKICQELEVVVVEHCMDSVLKLSAPKE